VYRTHCHELTVVLRPLCNRWDQKQVTTGELPWSGETADEIALSFRETQLVVPSYLSADCSDFIRLALHPQPALRLGSLGGNEVRHLCYNNNYN
jgi:hypothetical protein